LQGQGVFIVESVNNVNQVDQRKEWLQGNRTAAMDKIAAIVKVIMEKITVETLFVTGGDTLKRIMDELNLDGIIPNFELIPGIVFGNVNGINLQIISKSGGFGNVDVIEKALKQLLKLQDLQEQNK